MSSLRSFVVRLPKRVENQKIKGAQIGHVLIITMFDYKVSQLFPKVAQM